MYAIVWRHNANCEWNLMREPLATEKSARERIKRDERYDMARREYRIIALGEPDAWIDPVQEQAERLGVELAKQPCEECGLTGGHVMNCDNRKDAVHRMPTRHVWFEYDPPYDWKNSKHTLNCKARATGRLSDCNCAYDREVK